MVPDYHIHTSLCKHARGRMEEYVQAAIRSGLTEIAFTDHIPLPDDFDIAHRMQLSEFQTYFNEIDRLKKRYTQIKILTGIEADYYEGFEDFLSNFLGQYEFDLVIMSVHFIKSWPECNWVFYYDFPDRTLTEIYSDYLEAVLRGIRTGLFDIIGHLDLIKSANQSLLQENQAQVERILLEAKAKDMAIEINTSGLRKEINETFPAPSFLPLISKTGIPVTLGSDAHKPEQVALKFEETQKELHKFPKIRTVRFENREMIFEQKQR